MRRKHNLIFWLIFGLIGFCTLTVFLAYQSLGDEARTTIITEAAKSFIQLGTVGILGALVKYSFDQFSESQRKIQANLEVKRELLESLRKLKQTVKTAPYLIEEEQTVEAYRKGMRDLLNAYIEIGDFGSDTRLSNSIFPYNERIGIHLWTMSIFISKILDESAKNHPETWDQVLALPIFSDYRRAALDLLGKDNKRSSYKIDYDDHYDAIKHELRLLISKQISPVWASVQGSIESVERSVDITNSGFLYEIRISYLYQVHRREYHSTYIFSSFDERTAEYGFNYYSEAKDKRVQIYYDPAEPKISLIELPTQKKS